MGITGVACLLIGAALIEPQATVARQASPEPEKIRRPLGEIVGRTHRLKVSLGPLGPTYTLTDLHGHPIDADTSLDALARRHPDLPIGRHADRGTLMFADDRSADLHDNLR